MICRDNLFRFTKYLFAGLVFLIVITFSPYADSKDKKTKGCVILTAGQYLIPDDYGAYGDGKTDDTEAFRSALYEAEVQGKVLFIPPNRNYLISGPINFHDGKYRSCVINICGCLPIALGEYSISKYGGISLVAGTELFKNCKIQGSLERVSITGARNESIHLFDSCTCSSLIMYGCNISNLGAVFFDTSVNKTSKISYCKFLTVFYFSRNVNTSSCLTDSDISFNYINGGVELNDNVCFEWVSYNGVTISNNFIDYYRTIYQPNAIDKQSFVGPNSSNNQYQVFRYLYAPGKNINTITFYSYADSFNWTDPSTLRKLAEYKSLKYVGRDGVEYEYPPYIAICKSAWGTSIKMAKLERNISSVAFIDSSLTEYENNYFDVEFSCKKNSSNNSIIYRNDGDNCYFNNGKYMQNSMDIQGLVERVQVLPKVSIGWTSSPSGRIVICNNKKYRLTNNFIGGQWTTLWVEE